MQCTDEIKVDRIITDAIIIWKSYGIPPEVVHL